MCLFVSQLSFINPPILGINFGVHGELTYYEKILVKFVIFEEIGFDVIAFDFDALGSDNEIRKLIIEKLDEYSKTKIVILINKDSFLKDNKKVGKINFACSFENEKEKKKNKDSYFLNLIKTCSIRLPIKMWVLLFISFLCLSAIGVSTLTFTQDNIYNELVNAYDNGTKVVKLDCQVKETNLLVGAQGIPFYGDNVHNKKFDKKQLEDYRIFRETMPLFKVENNEEDNLKTFDSYINKNLNSDSEKLNPFNYFSNNIIESLIGVNELIDLEKMNLKPLTNESRLPTNSYEISITDYCYEVFKKFGFKQYNDDGTTFDLVEISEPNDLIGKIFNNYEIVGVFQTEESAEKIKEYDQDYLGEVKPNFSSDYYIPEECKRWLGGFHIMKSAFIYSEMNLSEADSVVYMLKNDINKDYNFINRGNYESNRETQKIESKIFVSSSYSYYVNSSPIIYNSNFNMLIIVFALAILTYSYFSFYFCLKKYYKSNYFKEVKRLVSGKCETICIMLFLIFVISTVIVSLTTLSVYLISILINFTCGYPYLFLNWLTILILFLIIYIPFALVNFGAFYKSNSLNKIK